METYPDEFNKIIKTSAENDFVLLGRTRGAFDTHPETQTLT
jgi:hypothetical protein